MGYHSVFCAITHAPIRGGDRCVAIWTQPPPYRDEFSSEQAASIFFSGEYDNYGRIEIDPDHKLADILNDEMLANPSMFIAESVYATLLTFSISKCGHTVNSGTAYANSDLTAYLLLKLGFVEDPDKVPDEPRYNRKFTHPSASTKCIHSDGRWGHLVHRKKTTPIYYCEHLEKYFPNVDYSYAHNTPTELVAIDSAWDKFCEEYDAEDYKGNTALSKFIEMQKDSLCERLNITSNLFPLLENQEFRQELAKVHRISRFMYANNLKFGYRFHSGPQDGNFDAHTKLTELMQMINAQQAKENEELEDD